MTNPYGVSTPTTIPADLLDAFNASTTAIEASPHPRSPTPAVNRGRCPRVVGVRTGERCLWSCLGGGHVLLPSPGRDRKADMFRGLLLTTGGEYERILHVRPPTGGVYEQGKIWRLTAYGATEGIFVEYSAGGSA